MPDRASIADEELNDYVDGRLPAARRAEIEAFLNRNPQAAAKVQRMQAINQALRGLATDILEEPPPERLLRALRRRRTTQ